MEQPYLSLIIPAYQEEKRIANTIESFATYLDQNHSGAELIVVCDGCTDKTAEVARSSFASQTCRLRVMEILPNQGKGNAVKEGMLAAEGQYCFFTDADLSFQPEVLDELLEKLKGDADIAIVQRKKETKYPGPARALIAVLSRWLIGNLILPGIRDTQAGFKGFKRDAARFLFSQARIKRFLFDLEILMLARRCGYRIEKVYVDWIDRSGSTVRIFVDTARALRDLLLILLWLTMNQYNTRRKSND